MTTLEEVRVRFARDQGLPFSDSLSRDSILDALEQHGVTHFRQSACARRWTHRRAQRTFANLLRSHQTDAPGIIQTGARRVSSYVAAKWATTRSPCTKAGACLSSKCFIVVSSAYSPTIVSRATAF